MNITLIILYKYNNIIIICYNVSPRENSRMYTNTFNTEDNNIAAEIHLYSSKKQIFIDSDFIIFCKSLKITRYYHYCNINICNKILVNYASLQILHTNTQGKLHSEPLLTLLLLV